jgi:hypothetical protein
MRGAEIPARAGALKCVRGDLNWFARKGFPLGQLAPAARAD